MSGQNTDRLESRAARIAGIVASARLRLVVTALVAGILLAAFLAVAWVVGGVLLDLAAPLPVALRTVVFAGWWLAVAAALGAFVLLPALRRPCLDAVALRVERLIGGIQNRLLTVVDVHRGGAATRGWRDDPARRAMVDRLVDQTEGKLSGFAPASVARRRPLVRGALLVAAAAALLGALFAGLGDRFTTTLARLLRPTADIPPATWLRLATPGDIEVLEGEPFEIAAEVTRGAVDGVDLVIGAADGTARREPMRAAEGGRFLAALDGLGEDAVYRVEGGGTWTKTHAIRLLRRPSVGEVSALVRLPAYMRTPEPLRVVPDAARIEAPEGSEVEFTAAVTGAVADGAARLLERRLETTLVERVDERVWFEDDLPRDAVAPVPWKWTTAQAAGGLRAFGFPADGRPLEMRTRLEPLVLPKEQLARRSFTLMARGDAAAPPSRLAVELIHDGGAVELVWGDDAAGPAADLRVPRIVVGPLPEPGAWARLTVLLEAVPQLVGRAVAGARFSIDRGRMLLDRPGWMERTTEPVQKPVDHETGRIAAVRDTDAAGAQRYRVAVPAGERGAAPVWAALEFTSPQGHPSRAQAPVEIVVTADQPPSLVVEEPQAELLQLSRLDEFAVVAHAFDDWGIDALAFQVGADEASLGPPQPLADVPLAHSPPDTQVVVETAFSPDRLGLSEGATGAFALAVRDTKGQWTVSRVFRVVVVAADAEPPPPPPVPALDEALREATEALAQATRDVDILDEKRKGVLEGVGKEALDGLDAAEEAAARQAEAAAAAAPEREAAAEAARTQTEAAQARADAAAAALEQPRKDDLALLDRFLDERREDARRVADALGRAAEQARSAADAGPETRSALEQAAEAARELEASLAPSPQFNADAARVDRLADAPPPSEIVDRLGRIASQTRGAATRMEAAEKARRIDSLADDLARRAESLDLLGERRREAREAGLPPRGAERQALDRQARQESREVGEIVGPEATPRAPAAEPADPLDGIVDSGRDAAREAARDAERIAEQLAGRGEQPAEQGAAAQQGQASADGQQGDQPGEQGSEGQRGQGRQGEGGEGRGSPPSPEQLQSLLDSREVQQALQMAQRAERLQARASRRAAEQLAAAQAASQQEGRGEGQPGATPTGEPTDVATDGGAQAGQAEVKEADLRGLDAARRAAIYKLPPRVRDPLLEGMRERGPAAYQEVIDTYFRQLGRDLPP